MVHVEKNMRTFTSLIYFKVVLHLQEVTSVVRCFTLPQCHICTMKKYRENTGCFFNMAELTMTRWNLVPNTWVKHVHNSEFGKSGLNMFIILSFSCENSYLCPPKMQ